MPSFRSQNEAVGPKGDSCLVLDSSNQWLLLGLENLGTWQSSRLEEPKSCFQLLPDLIRKLLETAKIEKADWIVSAIGPGSFTGTRLAVAFARNLAQLWQVPVMGVGSLDFYAYEILSKRRDIDRVALMLDAKQRSIYGMNLSREDSKTLFLQDPKKTFPLVNQEPDLFLEALGEDYQIFADEPQIIASYSRLRGKRRRKIEKIATPDPQYLYKLALKKGGLKASSFWAELKPLYLRNIPEKYVP